MVARSDGGALRTPRRLRVPETADRLRPAADRRADQSGPGDLAADHAVEPAGIRGQLGHAAGDSRRGVAPLRAAALPAIRQGHPRAEARRRRLPEPNRHAGDAEGGADSDFRRRGRRGAARRTSSTAPRRRWSSPPRPHRRRRPELGPQAPSPDLVAEAQAHYDRMQKAARDGDWALFGDEQKKLGETLGKLSRVKK